MTHTRNTPASRVDQSEDRPTPPPERSRPTDERSTSPDERATSTDDRASEHDFDERSLRARTESMDVFALGSGRYAVHSQSGHDYLVNVPEGTCTCPDHVIRGARCKHLRRVAIEITAGSVVPPRYVASTCASCGGFALVPPGAPEPHLCETHAIRVGDRAFDPETGEVVLVVAVSRRRADEVAIRRRDVTVAEYETNADYPGSDPVVEAVFPSVRVTEDGPQPERLRVYSFPLSRLIRLGDDERSPGECRARNRSG